MQQDIHADAADSDVVGSLLMVALTLLVATGAALVFQAFEGPEDPARAVVTVRHTPDGAVEVAHKGGDALDRDDVVVRIDHNDTLTTYSGAQLDGDWADGSLTVGESWTVALGLQPGDTLGVGVIHTPSNEILGSMPRFTIA